MEKLDQLEMIMEVLFCCCSVQTVLNHCSEPSGISEEDYVKLAFPYVTSKSEYRFSPDDLHNQFRFFQQQTVRESERSNYGSSVSRVINPMDCLFYYVGQMLHIENNEVVCRYRRLLNWCSLTRKIDADLLVAAFIAMEKKPEALCSRDLDWRLTLNHDNFQLRRIMERGIAENHFHLYGSAPVFHLSWISLMNRLNSSNAAARLRRYDKNRNEPETRVDITLLDPPLRLLHLQAAAIRLILFSILTLEDNLAFSEVILQDLINIPRFKDNGDEKRRIYKCLHSRRQKHARNERRPKDNDDQKRRIYKCLYSRRQKHARDERRSLDNDDEKRHIYRCLHRLIDLICTHYVSAEDSLLELEDLLNALQYSINALRDWNDSTLPNYALLVCPRNMKQDDDSIFQGERWLLYQCLHRIRHNMLDTKYVNLFYAYLIIKERIRHELIQSEDGVGFSRFQDYERRKFDLLEDSILQGKAGAAARAAVRKELLKNPSLQSLEIRVSPYENAEDNVDMLRHLDTILSAHNSDLCHVSTERFFYVFHFLKREDNWRDKDPSAFYCRHYLYRRTLLRQTIGIQNLRKRYPRRAMQVLGIDAASKELVCRPEVFGTYFRFLHKHTATLEESDGSHPLPQLHRTFHVGEDFLDIVDGLRAIDEAIRFLGLESGDRLGHALALGIDVYAWYAAKNNVITLTAQDYLDNVVWLYRHLLKYKLNNMTDVLEYLKREFMRLSDIIYKRHMSAETISHILEKYQEDSTIPLKYKWNQYDMGYDVPAQALRESLFPVNMPNGCNFDIHQYYRAWKLRGDDPELYDDGYFRPPVSDALYDECRVNQYYPRDNSIRYDPSVFLIHYYYHYSRDVREEGERQIQREVPPAYIDAVAKVQLAMQREIGSLGLGIECNPTSNVLIGTFKRYEQHPILRFYNRELEVDSKLLEDNPQLLVSINTDDKGIFSTSLENEYALMACALEKAVAPDDCARYPKQRVYAWLDAVRQMGLEQSFHHGRLMNTNLYGRRYHVDHRWRRR